MCAYGCGWVRGLSGPGMLKLHKCNAHNLHNFHCKFQPPPQFQLHICLNDNQMQSPAYRPTLIYHLRPASHFGTPFFPPFLPFPLFKTNEALSSGKEGLNPRGFGFPVRMTVWAAPGPLVNLSLYSSVRLRMWVAVGHRKSGCSQHL